MKADTRTPHPPAVPWYVVGLPGSGKTKIGRELAAFFGVPHIDTDALVEDTSGRSISSIFDTDGEDVFRILEADALESTAATPGVVSLGGGAVETARVRQFLAGQFVIWIDAEHDELLSRVRRHDKRPLLREDPDSTLAMLRERRDPLFAQVATITVTSTTAPAAAVVRAVLRSALDWDFAEVRGTHDYRVITGAGTTSLVSAHIPTGATRAFVVVPEALAALSSGIVESLEDSGLTVTVFPHIDGEQAKDLPTLAAAWDALGDATIGRRDVVVTFGGGVTTDLGGFLAATWLRGVKVLHIPTTLLAMVDASVGGKTGINTLAGKNLVGAFYDPIAVLVDLDTLATLPPAEYVAGMAEAIKTGFIRDPEILADVDRNPEIASVAWATGPGLPVLADIVRRSIAVKSTIVSEDRLEGGVREILNYGHTMGHAIERAEHYTMRHGEAVAIGSVFEAHLARELGYASDDLVAEHERLFASVGLPIRYVGNLRGVLSGLTSDKKVRQGNLRFVVLSDLCETHVVPVDPDVVKKVAVRLRMDSGGFGEW